MIDLGIFYSKLATVGLIILLGFILGRTKFITETTNKQLTNLLLSIAMPASLFMAFPREFNHGAFSDFAFGFLGGVAVSLVLILLSKVLFSKKMLHSRANEHQFAFIFNNAGFLGYPLVYALFGEKMLMAYCGFSFVFNVSLFSYGVFLFEEKLSKSVVKKTILNPNILAVVLGFALFVLPFELKLPDFATNFLNYIGGIMTPLSLICIGFLLSKAKIANIFKKPQLFITCLLQLIFGPILTLLVVSILGLPVHIKVMLVLLQSLPTATTLGLFAEKYGRDTDEASEIVMVSTLLSILTLPLMSIVISMIK